MAATHHFYRSILLLACIALTYCVQAQKRSFENLLEVRLENIEPISYKDEVKGYCMYYYLDAAKESNMGNYKMIILDEDLNKISEKTFVQSKNLSLKMVSYNGKTLLLVLGESTKNNIVFQQYDLQCNLLSTVTDNESSMTEQFFLGRSSVYPTKSSEIHVLDGIGYLVYTFFGNGAFKYRVRCIAEDGKLLWSRASDMKESGTRGLIYLASNDQMILNKNHIDFEDAYKVVALDSKTGKDLFDKKVKIGKQTALFLSAFPDSLGTFTVCGELYNDEDEKNVVLEGLFIGTLDKSGNFIRTKTYTLDQIVSTKAKIVDGKIEGKGMPYFHEAIRLGDGRIFLVGECYDVYGKRAHAGISLNDLMVVEFSKDLNQVDVNFTKKVSLLPDVATMVKPRNITKYISSVGAFDYLSYQKSANYFTFFYNIDPNKEIKGDKRKRGTVSRRVGETEFQTDQIVVETEADNTYLLPAKPGHILMVEYTAKTKKMDMRLEKFNY